MILCKPQMRAERAKKILDNSYQLILLVNICRVNLIFCLSKSAYQSICRVQKKRTCRIFTSLLALGEHLWCAIVVCKPRNFVTKLHEIGIFDDLLPAKFDETRKISTKQGVFVAFCGLFEIFCFGLARLISSRLVPFFLGSHTLSELCSCSKYAEQEGGQYGHFTKCERFWTFLVKVARGEK